MDLASFHLFLFSRLDAETPDALHESPGCENRKGERRRHHHVSGDAFRQPAGILEALGEIGGQAREIIGQRRGRDALDYAVPIRR